MIPDRVILPFVHRQRRSLEIREILIPPPTSNHYLGLFAAF